MFKGTSNTSQKKLTTTNEHERADKDEEEEEEATRPKESEVEVVNTTEWQWPSYQRIMDRETHELKWSLRDLEEEKDEGNKGTDHPFAVYYDNNISIASEIVTLKIYSQPLLGILKELLVPDQVKDQKKSYSEILAKELFHVYVEGKLQKYTKEIGDLTETQIHVSHLLRFLDQEFRTVKPRYLQMKTSGRVQWDMLWTLFIRKEKVVYRLIRDEVCGEVISTGYNSSSGQKRKFAILLSVWDYDCKNYRKYDMQRSIGEYEWEQEITKLSVYPLHYKLDTQNAEEYFLSRGKKFYELVMKTDHCFMQYKGLKFVKDLERLRRPPIYNEYWDDENWDDEVTLKENTDGRVMIDHRSSAKLNPDLKMGNAQPAQNVLLGAEIELEDSNLDTSLDPGSDPNLMFAPAIVYGFSFSLRRWGAFSVSGFENIMFRSDAFESLVMEHDRKEMIFMLVNEYIKEPVAGDLQMTSIDPIAKKGQGCIILCHGPPGTGKTFTAESIAEKLECPLWSMSVAELGMFTEDLEKKLVQIFEVAACWRAILLLDEADVYLERRKDSTFSSLTQSAMTGVFLRILEYYSGVLFLTTNRMESVDDAISSRVSIFLEYKEFDTDHRLKVWKTFLKRANIAHSCSETFWSEVAGLKFNGREIRNVVHNAQILAKSKQETVTEDHILSALKIMGSSRVPKVFQIKDSVDTDTKSMQSMPIEESHEEIDSIEYASSRNR